MFNVHLNVINVDSNVFYSKQGLPSDTLVDSDKSTHTITEFITLFVGAPIKGKNVISDLRADMVRSQLIISELKR